ncbi:MAG: hypothetical protein EBS53_19380 [Bacteroidetes bacterium]|nr:hypothetical protein [Bacteroidota bacterium]
MLQPFSAGTDVFGDLCQAPASVPGDKPMNCSDTSAIDKKQTEQWIRDCKQTTIHLMGEVGSGADVNADGDDPHWPARSPAACSSQSEEILPDENVTPKKLLPVFELRSEAELIKIREDAEKYWEDLQREQGPRRKENPSPVFGSNC